MLIKPRDLQLNLMSIVRAGPVPVPVYRNQFIYLAHTKHIIRWIAIEARGRGEGGTIDWRYESAEPSRVCPLTFVYVPVWHA